MVRILLYSSEKSFHFSVRLLPRCIRIIVQPCSPLEELKITFARIRQQHPHQWKHRIPEETRRFQLQTLIGRKGWVAISQESNICFLSLTSPPQIRHVQTAFMSLSQWVMNRTLWGWMCNVYQIRKANSAVGVWGGVFTHGERLTRDESQKSPLIGVEMWLNALLRTGGKKKKKSQNQIEKKAIYGDHGFEISII